MKTLLTLSCDKILRGLLRGVLQPTETATIPLGTAVGIAMTIDGESPGRLLDGKGPTIETVIAKGITRLTAAEVGVTAGVAVRAEVARSTDRKAGR